MKFYYNDQGQVKMRSDKPIETSLNELDYTPSQEEKELLKENYILSIENGVVKFEKSSSIKQADSEAIKQTLKDKAEKGKLTLEDLNIFVKDFL